MRSQRESRSRSPLRRLHRSRRSPIGRDLLNQTQASLDLHPFPREASHPISPGYRHLHRHQSVQDLWSPVILPRTTRVQSGRGAHRGAHPGHSNVALGAPRELSTVSEGIIGDGTRQNAAQSKTKAEGPCEGQSKTQGCRQTDCTTRCSTTTSSCSSGGCGSWRSGGLVGWWTCFIEGCSARAVGPRSEGGSGRGILLHSPLSSSGSCGQGRNRFRSSSPSRQVRTTRTFSNTPRGSPGGWSGFIGAMRTVQETELPRT